MGNSLFSREALIGELCRQYGARKEDVQRLLANQPYVDLAKQRIDAYRQLNDNPVGSEPYNQALEDSYKLMEQESKLPGVDNPLLDSARLASFVIISRADRLCEHD